MLSKISLNPITKRGLKKPGNILNSQKVNFSFGLPEWQQPFKSTSQIYYDQKTLQGNRVVLNNKYLKPNYSQIEFKSCPQDKPFLTSNQRDFKLHSIDKNSNYNELLKQRINFIRKSQIILGNDESEKKSIYGFYYNDPKITTDRYDYNKINFRYNPFNLHPITQKLVWKDPNNMFPFEYFNKDKDKRFVIKRSGSCINTDYRKVWDPITNRFFKGSLRNLSNNRENI